MSRFEQFIKHREYLMSVTENTVRWHRCALKWLPDENPTQEQLEQMVVRMKERGLKETGCNAVIRSVNAYLHWNSGFDGKCGSACKHPKLRSLREPTIIMPSFTEEQVRLLLKYKPKTVFRRRLHLLILVLFDTGARISEALALHASDIDLDNMLVRLKGKGRKERLVPISFELRKALFRFMDGKQRQVFTTSNGTVWSRIGALRAVKLHCQRLGFEPPARTLHACRHTFASNYVRRGGSVFHLQRQLGHSSLEMSRRYTNLRTEDLQAIHAKVSLLSA
jgi:integrase/recombinase XerD